MKRHLVPSLFALSLCALLGGARTANAQVAEDAVVPAGIDSIAVAAPATPAGESVVSAPASSLSLSPIMQPASAILRREIGGTVEPLAPHSAAFQGGGWRMPASRTLMIGGTAAVIVGLAAIGGDAGAIVALSGGAVAVYGLYLHYNR